MCIQAQQSPAMKPRPTALRAAAWTGHLPVKPPHPPERDADALLRQTSIVRSRDPDFRPPLDGGYPAPKQCRWLAITVQVDQRPRRLRRPQTAVGWTGGPEGRSLRERGGQAGARAPPAPPAGEVDRPPPSGDPPSRSSSACLEVSVEKGCTGRSFRLCPALHPTLRLWCVRLFAHAARLFNPQNAVFQRRVFCHGNSPRAAGSFPLLLPGP